jgi:hypothetical protein
MDRASRPAAATCGWARGTWRSSIVSSTPLIIFFVVGLVIIIVKSA